MKVPAWFAVSSWLFGCAAQPAMLAQPPPAAAAFVPAPASAARDPRRLPEHSTFADLVDAARAVDDANAANPTDPASEPGCLIDLRAGAPRLAADVLVGARPLAEAPAELATALARAAGPAAVISGWGAAAGEVLEVALVAFTTTTAGAAKAPALAAFLTRQGVFLRSAHLAIRAHPEAMTLEAAVALLVDVPDPAVVYVSAEAAIPLDQVMTLLRAIPNRFEVSLAVALPRGTRLPAPPTADSAELTCPNGLPEPREDEPEGALDPTSLRDTLAPLREAALSCALSTGGRAMQGGRLVLGLRIDAGGAVRDACMVSDPIGELMLRRCVIAATRKLRAAAPSPGGFVDVHLPLDLALAGPAAQRALCE